MSDDVTAKSASPTAGTANTAAASNPNTSLNIPLRGISRPRFTTSPKPTSFGADGCSSDEDEENQFSATPTFSETAHGLRRTLSLRALQELEMDHVRRRVWRSNDEPRRRPKDLEQLVVHALRSAFRAFALAYSIKSSINLVFTILRTVRARKFRLATFVEAILGTDSLQFGSMLGSFVLLWKISFHSLRLYNPGRKGPGRSEYWHGAVAGAISGLSVLCETKSFRVSTAQQLFIRGAQGLYNSAHKQGLVDIPNGDALLFGLACSQIMYGWLASPDSLPSWYNGWISNASRIPISFIPFNVARIRTPERPPPLENVYKILEWDKIAPGNISKVAQLIDDVNHGNYGLPMAPCEITHANYESCTLARVDKFKQVYKWMIPAYAVLHFIPPILFKRKAFLKQPVQNVVRSTVGTLRSSAFLASFVVIVEIVVCSQRDMYSRWIQYLPQPIQDIWLSKYYNLLPGLATGLAVFIEEKKRRSELALYVLPKALESLWTNGRKRNIVPHIPAGEVMLASGALAMIMNTYQRDPQSLSGLVRSILYQFVGHS